MKVKAIKKGEEMYLEAYNEYKGEGSFRDTFNEDHKDLILTDAPLIEGRIYDMDLFKMVWQYEDSPGVFIDMIASPFEHNTRQIAKLKKKEETHENDFDVTGHCIELPEPVKQSEEEILDIFYDKFCKGKKIQGLYTTEFLEFMKSEGYTIRKIG